MIKLVYVYQNYRKSYSGLGVSFLSKFRKNPGLEILSFEFEPLSYRHTINRVVNRLPYLKDIHFKIENKRLVDYVMKQKPTHVFVMKGTDLQPTTLEAIKQIHPSVRLYCFNPDDPFNLNNASSKESILNCIPLYDHYFVWSRKFLTPIGELGTNVSFLPFATDRDLIYPVEPLTVSYDLSFIGNGDNERNEWIKKIADYIIDHKIDMNLHVFGANINPVAGISIEGQKNGKDYLQTVVSSKININILRLQNKNSTNMRTFEIPAAGGFMLHEYSDEAKDIFIEDKEAVYFSTIEELVDKAKFYINNESRRMKIREKGYMKATKYEQTYESRVGEILLHMTENN